MYKIYKIILISLGLLGLVSCGGGGSEQVSGVITEAVFTTPLCQPQTKIVNIRNDDEREPQRIQNVMFEMGSNQTGFFSIDKVTVGSAEYTGTIQDVLIPAGGILSIQTTYNPRSPTAQELFHLGHISLFLNGPRLGILQIKTLGSTTTADAVACGQELQFNITEAKVYIKRPGESQEASATLPPISSPLKISISGNTATLTQQGFPSIVIPVPGFGNVPAGIEGNFTSRTNGTNFEFQNFVIKLTGNINFTGTLTTGRASTTNDRGDSLSKEGSPLNNRQMKLVFAATVPNEGLAASFAGTLIAAEISLTQR